MSGMGHQRPYAVSSAIGCRAPKPVIPTSVNGRRGSTIAAVGDRPVAQLLHLRDINRFPPAIGVVRRSGSQCGSSRCRSSARQIADIISTNRALTIPGIWEANPLMASFQAKTRPVFTAIGWA